MNITSRQLEADEFFKANGAKVRYLHYLLAEEIDPDSEWGEAVRQAIEEGEASIAENSGCEEAETAFDCSFCTNEIPFDELDMAANNGGLCTHCAHEAQEL